MENLNESRRFINPKGVKDEIQQKKEDVLIEIVDGLFENEDELMKKLLIYDKIREIELKDITERDNNQLKRELNEKEKQIENRDKKIEELKDELSEAKDKQQVINVVIEMLKIGVPAVTAWIILKTLIFFEKNDTITSKGLQLLWKVLKF